jgi:hypothetical protein
MIVWRSLGNKCWRELPSSLSINPWPDKLLTPRLQDRARRRRDVRTGALRVSIPRNRLHPALHPIREFEPGDLPYPILCLDIFLVRSQHTAMLTVRGVVPLRRVLPPDFEGDQAGRLDFQEFHL